MRLIPQEQVFPARVCLGYGKCNVIAPQISLHHPIGAVGFVI